MKSKYLIGYFLTMITASSVFADTNYTSCVEDADRQKMRSKELQKIVVADQKDRENWEQKTREEMQQMALRDRERRERVGAIFGEGCFQDAKDYAAAALVFQHGDRPDHYFQTFLWSKRAVELGDSKQKRMMALGIDRYLVNIGQKQLFASQAQKIEKCWCLSQIEESFPEKTREDYKLSTKQQFEWLNELNKGTDCPAVECKKALKDSPKGTVPGFW